MVGIHTPALPSGTEGALPAAGQMAQLCFQPTFLGWSRQYRLENSSSLRYHYCGSGIHIKPIVRSLFCAEWGLEPVFREMMSLSDKPQGLGLPRRADRTSVEDRALPSAGSGRIVRAYPRGLHRGQGRMESYCRGNRIPWAVCTAL